MKLFRKKKYHSVWNGYWKYNFLLKRNDLTCSSQGTTKLVLVISNSMKWNIIWISLKILAQQDEDMQTYTSCGIRKSAYTKYLKKMVAFTLFIPKHYNWTEIWHVRCVPLFSLLRNVSQMETCTRMKAVWGGYSYSHTVNEEIHWKSGPCGPTLLHHQTKMWDSWKCFTHK